MPLTFYLSWELNCSQSTASAVLCKELSFWNDKPILLLWHAGQVACDTKHGITDVVSMLPGSWEDSFAHTQRCKVHVLYTPEQKWKDVFLHFKCLDVFFASWKRRYLSMDSQRDFSLLWARQGRSAVSQRGLCSRLLLFSAILSHLHSLIKQLFLQAAGACTHRISS